MTKDLDVALILGKTKKGSSRVHDDELDEDDGDDADDKVVAAEEVLDALKSKDARALSEALEAHYKMCAAKSHASDDDEEEY
jgi:DNA-binding GntR family transcriptional regulator